MPGSQLLHSCSNNISSQGHLLHQPCCGFCFRYFSFVDFSLLFSLQVSRTVSSELLSSLFLSLVALQGKILPCHFAQSVHTACAATGYLYAHDPLGSHFPTGMMASWPCSLLDWIPQTSMHSAGWGRSGPEVALCLSPPCPLSSASLSTPAGLTAVGISSTAAWRAASDTRSSASRHSWGCCARSSSTPSARPTSRTARSGPCPGCHSPLQSPADIGRTHEHTLCSVPTGVQAWSYLPCGLPLWRSSCRARTLAGTGPWSCGLRSQCPLTRESRWCSVAGP